MSVQPHRRASSHKHRRASHFALAKVNYQTCPKCRKAILPHRACRYCGTYKGRNVL